MNRMKLWRIRKMSQEAGRQTQICVWAPEHDADLVREICARVAEATSRGEDLRRSLTPQIGRRRTIHSQWGGTILRLEIDYPFVGPRWSMLNIGGRITGSDGTHIEMSPEEAADLKDRLSRVCQKEIESWAESRKLLGRVRDNTGVVTAKQFLDRTAAEHPNRQADETAFAANEAKIASAITEAVRPTFEQHADDNSVIEYEGLSGFPSFCQIAHRKQGNHVQFALIHMDHGGISPTNMFAGLATYMRQRFYPDVDAGQIDWFDVIPKHVDGALRSITINPVIMQHANGIYFSPTWSSASSDNSEDLAAFIKGTIYHLACVTGAAG
jgi:hypothetical protein